MVNDWIHGGRNRALGLRLEPERAAAQVLAGWRRKMFERVRGFLAPVLPSRLRPSLVVVPVGRLSGIIGFTTPLRPGLTPSSVARSLERAVARPNATSVALAINSPAASARQSP